MRNGNVIVRVSIGMCMIALVSPVFGQTGVRMNPRGGVRIGSLSAGAMSRGSSRVPTVAVVGGNSFLHGSFGGRYGYQPRAIYGDSIRIDGRLFNDDVSVHFGDRSGFRARGSFDDGDFSLRFRLDSGLNDHLSHDLLHRSRQHRIFNSYYGLPYYNSYGSYGRYGYYEPVYAIGPTYVSQPAPPPPPPPAVVTEPQTPYEEGLGHLWRDEIDDAIRVLNGVVLDDDANGEAQRMLALALISKGRVADGVAMMRAAYDNDPALAREPIETVILGVKSERILGRLVRRVSMHANKVESASGWLTLGALMQAQGRPERAGMMLKRAVDAGLERSMGEAFGLPLG